jgi:hypothetical protein
LIGWFKDYIKEKKMPMDDYDQAHVFKYDHIINIYENDDIDAVLLKSFGHIQEEMKKIIIQGRNSFFILDQRYITNIGARFFDYSQEKTRIILLQIWRGKNYHGVWNFQ